MSTILDISGNTISTTSGAVIIRGGLDIDGNAQFNGILNVGGSTKSSNYYINNITGGTIGFALSNASTFSDSATNKVRIFNNNSSSYFDFASSGDSKLTWRYGSANTTVLTLNGSNGNLTATGAITGTSLSTGTGGITGGYITGSTLYVGTGGITGGYISGNTLAVTESVSGAYITAPQISTGSSGNMATGILRIYDDGGNGLEINSGSTNDNKWLINHYKTERLLKFRAWLDTGVGWKTNHAFAIYGNGSIRAEGIVYGTSFSSTSDYRLKQNVKLLSETNKSIDELKPIEYDLSGGNHDMGFLAHEVQEIFPFLVNGEKDGKEFQSINYNGFIALLVKEIQDLKKNFDYLKNNFDDLKKEMNDIKNKFYTSEDLYQ